MRGVRRTGVSTRIVYDYTIVSFRRTGLGTADAIGKRIRTGILSGEFAPGERLKQDELARRLGVSKIPVREALQRLSAEGLVAFEPNRGFEIRALDAEAAREIYGLREAVEPVLLSEAIPRQTIVDLARAEFSLSDDQMAGPARNWAFHQALYAPSGWRRGLSIVEALHTAVAPYVSLYTADPEAQERSESQHHRMLTSCREGDVSGALLALRQHLAMAREGLEGALRGPDVHP